MSGPFAEFLPPQIAVGMAGWRWRMSIEVRMTPEPHAVIVCARGRCRQVLIEMRPTERDPDGTKIDAADIADLCKEHLPECRSGQTTIGGHVRRIA